jgi:hypothetical protein
MRLAMPGLHRILGDDVDRRRIKLQLRLVTAIVRAEGGRNSRVRTYVAERSTLILDRVAIDIRPEKDPELAELLAEARAAVEELPVEAG